MAKPTGTRRHPDDPASMLRLVGTDQPAPAPTDGVAPQAADPHLVQEDHALELVDELSRRIDVLARELRVLGHFEGNDGRPRAA